MAVARRRRAHLFDVYDRRRVAAECCGARAFPIIRWNLIAQRPLREDRGVEMPSIITGN